MHRLVSCILLFVCMMTLCVSCGKKTVAAEKTYPVYEKYYDIPGVTAEEVAAVDALREKYGSFIYAMNTSTETFVMDDGLFGGYTSEFCEWLTSLFDIPFNIEIVEWDFLMDGLKAHELDFTGELTADDERRQTFFMTEAIAERSLKSFRLRGAESIANIRSTRILRYAFLNGTNAYANVSENSEQTFEATFVDDIETAVALLRDGSIDAFFEDGPAEAAFDIYEDIEAAEFFPLIYTPVSLTTANPELEPIINIVQKYLDNGAMYQLTDLYNTGVEEYLHHKLFSQLTDEEAEYLDSHDSVLYAAEFDNYPASFYNETEKMWQGISIDVLDEISRLTGLQFEIANGPDVVWPELLDMLDSGKVSFITELIPSVDRLDKYLWPEDSYSVDTFALISLSQKKSIRVNQIWHSTIAVTKDTAYEEVFDKWFPNHQNTLRFEGTAECFDALEDGSADFLLASRNSMLSMTNYSEKPGFKINILFNYEYESTFGLSKNEAILCSIFSKAQKLVDTKSITEGWEHRVFDYRAKMVRSQVPYLAGLAVMLIAVLILVTMLFIRNRRTGRQLEILVGQRTKELEIQTDAAKTASRSKSEFLSRMSHEIRTPLNAIIGMAQIMRQVPDVPQKARVANDEIITASQHLLGLLNDILDMAKIESGKFALVNEPFELLPAMSEVAEIIAQRSSETDTAFKPVFVGIDDVCVSGDKLRLKQVLINLLGNAIKFTDSNGWVKFSVRKTHDTGDMVTLEFVVEDTGIGMTEEQVSKLFAAFEQTDDSISVRYGGTGLGLAISQSMVIEMGGKIEVSSTFGEGSRFWFTLTMPKAELVADTAFDEDELDLRGQKILLAEDVEINRVICIELLAGTGAIIEEAEDGIIALEMFKSSADRYYDLILMDIQMPNMNGYETAIAIRALDRADAKSVPIIAMTANAYNEDVENAIKSGMNAHIAKPLDINVMRLTIRKTLRPGK